MKNKTAIIIPAYNEETVIKLTIQSCIKLVGKEHVYVVIDQSTDSTPKIAKKLTKNVYEVYKRGGKASALNRGMKKFELTKKYKFIMPVDSDTVVSPDFLSKALKHFEEDKKLVAVVGKVNGRKVNWITSFRSFEYEINQAIHKQAQSLLSGVSVCTGVSTVYRSKVFKKIKYPLDTFTEDMDLTFQIHRNKLGKISYDPNISVSTQDPRTLPSYIKQLSRWYAGFWQCISKHHMPFGAQSLDLETAVLATDGILNLFMVLMYLAVLPILIYSMPRALLIPPLLDFLFFMIPMLSYVAIKQNRPKLFLYIPHFYFLRLISSAIFVYSFFRVILGFGSDNKGLWQTERYKANKKEVWDI
jgi:poly-beta-1,6-N-acetyl-D-glucosamine synthase